MQTINEIKGDDNNKLTNVWWYGKPILLLIISNTSKLWDLIKNITRMVTGEIYFEKFGENVELCDIPGSAQIMQIFILMFGLAWVMKMKLEEKSIQKLSINMNLMSKTKIIQFFCIVLYMGEEVDNDIIDSKIDKVWQQPKTNYIALWH